MKEYFNKNLGFKFYTKIDVEELPLSVNSDYRFWICDSNKRICDYYSKDIILHLAEQRGISEEEMQELLAQELEQETSFTAFMNSFCTTYEWQTVENIDCFVSDKENYQGLTTQEKVEKWYSDDDYSNIFGNYLILLF